MPFTVEFNDNGKITRVFSGAVKSAEGQQVHAKDLGTCTKHLPRVETVTIHLEEPVVGGGAPDPCVKQGGKEYCW